MTTGLPILICQYFDRVLHFEHSVPVLFGKTNHFLNVAFKLI